MALFKLSSPPLLGKFLSSYREYKPWLLYNFYDQLCAYCLCQCLGSLQVDHYVPTSYKPWLERNPDNLLLSCGSCNRSKWDYHPCFRQRKKLANGPNYKVIDIREDDFETMFKVEDDGTLGVRNECERALFNLEILFDLNKDVYVKARRNALRYKKGAEALVNSNLLQHKDALNALIPLCAERSLFYYVYGISLSERLVLEINRFLHLQEQQQYAFNVTNSTDEDETALNPKTEESVRHPHK